MNNNIRLIEKKFNVVRKKEPLTSGYSIDLIRQQEQESDHEDRIDLLQGKGSLVIITFSGHFLSPLLSSFIFIVLLCGCQKPETEVFYKLCFVKKKVFILKQIFCHES